MMSMIGRIVTNVGTGKNVKGIYNSMNGLHTTTAMQLDQSWRQRRRLPENPNVFGPLTNLPDYSYEDGRPVPFGVRMLGRINKQREILKRVRQLTSEVDYAVKRYERLETQKKQFRTSILESKLMPKGEKLMIEAKSEDKARLGTSKKTRG